MRIRHVLAGVVASCAAAGIALALGIAFLHDSLREGTRLVGERSAVLREVQVARRAVDGLAEEPGGAAPPELVLTLRELAGRGGEASSRLHAAASCIEAMAEGADLHERLLPGPSRREVEESLASLAARASAELSAAERAFEASLTAAADGVGALQSRLAWSLAVAPLAYGLLVVCLWHLTQRLLLSPLQDLAREAERRRGDGEAFALAPRGPYEVRQLTEVLSELVDRLVASRRELESKVRERTIELERANRAKDEFLANVSHEIRTPLTAILGYAALCEEEDFDPELTRGYLGVVRSNGQHLMTILNDILDVARIEARQMKIEPAPCSPREVVESAIEFVRVAAEAKGIGLRADFAADVPARVVTDPVRLRQIVLNLLSNAVKFTEAGEVRATATMRVEGGRRLLCVEVADTGVGIPSEDVERVFDPFVQVDGSAARRHGGTGLGLAISRRLARLLGGDVTGESEPGRGSRFAVTVAAGEQAEADEPAASPPAALPREAPERAAERLSGRVLLAEDVATNRLLVATVLRRAGLDVDEAANGREALEAALAARAAGERHDLVLMDMQMPEMDGYEAVRRLRAAGYDAPIVALTAHSMTGERERCLAAGCDGFATKPIGRDALLALANEHFGAGAAAGPRAPSRAASRKGARKNGRRIARRKE